MSIKYYLSKLFSKIQFPSIKDCQIEKTARIYEKSSLSKVKLGRYSYVAKNTTITDAIIGSFCSIGSLCQIGGGIHPTNMVSTSPAFLSGKSAVGVNFGTIDYHPSETVFVGDDVWIGSGVYIKAGVRIGTGAIIGAHAVVTHDVEPYAVVTGVPAKVLRKRFDDETIEKLLATKWWDWPDEKLRKYAEFFDSPERLIEKVESETK